MVAGGKGQDRYNKKGREERCRREDTAGEGEEMGMICGIFFNILYEIPNYPCNIVINKAKIFNRGKLFKRTKDDELQLFTDQKV